MNSVKLRKYPDKCLGLKTKDVRDFSKEFKSMVHSMADIMYLNQGIGLAATQVGLDLKFMIIDIGDGEGLKVYANPEITYLSDSKDKMEEGCLSLPGVSVEVLRPKEIEVKAININGEEFNARYMGLMAKVVQHETDHLYGKLIIDYLNPISKMIKTRKLRRDN
jgi:peptide deformylase